jgi:DNA-binding beta-propeller fold protein YncE
VSRRCRLAVLLVVLCAVGLATTYVSAVAADEAAFPLKLVARIGLPGPSNRFDYTSIDPSTHRLYIAHMNAGKLLVFDLDSRRVVHVIDAPGVHGVIAVPTLHRVFASATDDHEVLTIDARTNKVLAHAPAGSYPDGLAYDSALRRVFVSDESGGVETVLNARGKRIATIQLGGEAGNVQYDAASGRILVAVQTRDEVAVIDPVRNVVVRRVPVACDHPHGLLVDSPHRLAFVACDGNAKLLTLDLRNLRVTGTADVGPSPDVLAFDTSLRRLYVAAESGQVAVFAEGARSVRKLGQTELAPEAHSVAVDSASHLVYFPLEGGANGEPQLLIMKPR